MQNQNASTPPVLANPYSENKLDIDYNRTKRNFKFLYVGTDQAAIHHMEKIFQSGWTAQNFLEAKQHFTESDFYNQSIPDVILIDKPVVRSEIASFYSFLKENQLLLNTLLIYHSVHLKKDDLLFLQQQRFIDDVVEITSEKIDFHNKIIFLKKVKRKEGREQKPVVPQSIKPRSPHRFSLLVKRIFDITFALVAIVLFLPLMAIIAILLKLESKSSVLYIAKRAGNGFRVFDFYKFRTMVPDADKNIEALIHENQYAVNSSGAMFFKIANDPRITPLGRFLRNTSLDELPQFFNVLKGDMSVVGNRPLPIYEAVTLTTDEFVERFSAPAGITGLWQIKKRGNAKMSAEERINLDISYSRNYGIVYDLKIMAHTPIALFQKTTV